MVVHMQVPPPVGGIRIVVERCFPQSARVARGRSHQAHVQPVRAQAQMRTMGPSQLGIELEEEGD